MPSRALVLGGGGVTGIAWELGVLHGLAQEGVDLTTADLVVGTSAGSVVGAQLRSGTPLSALYDAQLAPPDGEVPARLGATTLARMALPMLLPGTPVERRARLGRAARRARPGDGAERVAVIRERVPEERWPAGDLAVTCVDADTGALVVLDRDGGVDLVHAVAASCAVPMVWPPVSVGGRHLVDGGVRSLANVDLAAGHDAVVVLAPVTRGFSRRSAPAAQLARLEQDGLTRSALLSPDAEARRAIGRNVLDPARRAGSARAGLRQGRAAAELVAAAWG